MHVEVANYLRLLAEILNSQRPSFFLHSATTEQDNSEFVPARRRPAGGEAPPDAAPPRLPCVCVCMCVCALWVCVSDTDTQTHRQTQTQTQTQTHICMHYVCVCMCVSV
jgi:hypothetical protein